MRSLRFLPLLVIGLAALSACDSAVPAGGELRAEGLSLTTDARAYAVGDVVTLTLRNDGDTTADSGFLACTLLEVEAPSGWVRSSEGDGRACLGVVVPLPPGETAAARVRLDGVSAGTYRFAQHLGGGTVATAAFEVR